jgi:hypothetical protein
MAGSNAVKQILQESFQPLADCAAGSGYCSNAQLIKKNDSSPTHSTGDYDIHALTVNEPGNDSRFVIREVGIANCLYLINFAILKIHQHKKRTAAEVRVYSRIQTGRIVYRKRNAHRISLLIREMLMIHLPLCLLPFDCGLRGGAELGVLAAQICRYPGVRCTLFSYEDRIPAMNLRNELAAKPIKATTMPRMKSSRRSLCRLMQISLFAFISYISSNNFFPSARGFLALASVDCMHIAMNRPAGFAYCNSPLPIPAAVLPTNRRLEETFARSGYGTTSAFLKGK